MWIQRGRSHNTDQVSQHTQPCLKILQLAPSCWQHTGELVVGQAPVAAGALSCYQLIHTKLQHRLHGSAIVPGQTASPLEVVLAQVMVSEAAATSREKYQPTAIMYSGRCQAA